MVWVATWWHPDLSVDIPNLNLFRVLACFQPIRSCFRAHCGSQRNAWNFFPVRKDNPRRGCNLHHPGNPTPVVLTLLPGINISNFLLLNFKKCEMHFWRATSEGAGLGGGVRFYKKKKYLKFQESNAGSLTEDFRFL